MLRSTAANLIMTIISVLLLLTTASVLAGCDEEKKPTALPPMDEKAKHKVLEHKRKRLGMITDEDRKEARTDHAAQERARALLRAEEARQRVPLAPTLGPNLATAAYHKLLRGKKAGTFSSSAIGDNLVVRGIARAQCGEGMVLQVLYSNSEDDPNIYTMPPLSLNVFALTPGKTLAYEDGPARVAMTVEEDSDKRFKGTLKVEVKTATGWSPLMDMRFDGPPPLPQLPQINFDRKKIPGGRTDATCFATGHFVLKAKDGRVFKGHVSGIDLSDKATPSIRIPLSPQDMITILVVPPAPYTEVPKPTTATLRKVMPVRARPFRASVEAIHRDTLRPTAENTGKNIDNPDRATLHEGTITYQMKPEGKPPRAQKPDTRRWHTNITLRNTRIGETIEGSLAGLEIEELRIGAYLINKHTDTITMPAAPAWFTSAVERRETPPRPATSAPGEAATNNTTGSTTGATTNNAAPTP